MSSPGDPLPCRRRPRRSPGARCGGRARLPNSCTITRVTPSRLRAAIASPVSAAARSAGPGYVDAGDVGPQQFAPGVRAGEVRTGQPPHGAVLAVAADHVAGARTGPDPPRPTARRRSTPSGLVGQPGQPVAPPQVRTELGGPLLQDLLGPGLRAPSTARGSEPGSVRSSGMPPKWPRGSLGGVPKRVQQAAAVEDLHGAGVQGGGPRLGGRPGPLVQHDHLGPAEPQLAGEHAGRPGRRRRRSTSGVGCPAGAPVVSACDFSA